MAATDNEPATPAPLWLNPAYSRQIVKGNLMTLSAKPKTVEQGEWIAHHGKSDTLLPMQADLDLAGLRD